MLIGGLHESSRSCSVVGRSVVANRAIGCAGAEETEIDAPNKATTALFGKCFDQLDPDMNIIGFDLQKNTINVAVI